MRPDKFTQKMQEAVQAAQDIASKHSHQEINNRHFLLGLLDQPEGVTRPLLEKMGVSVPKLWQRVRDDLDKQSSVHGGSGLPHFGSELVKVIDEAEREMERDEGRIPQRRALPSSRSRIRRPWPAISCAMPASPARNSCRRSSRCAAHSA